ncbi:MAG: hypothetical protein JWN90_196 [Parcubacteria group bacterium]|nr:hypothetical protein [Parcubacteria group bacterium]
MFLWSFLILEGVVAFEAFLSYCRGFLYRGQGTEPQPGHRISFFIKHGGMWGDLFIVSAVVASLISRGLPYWDRTDYVVSGTISLILTVCMVIFWGIGSRTMDDSFTKNGWPTACGVLHALYMFVAIAVLILYYAFTPVAVTTPLFRGVISIALMIHIIAGIIQPDWHANGKVSRTTWVIAVCAWIILLAAWLRPYVL